MKMLVPILAIAFLLSPVRATSQNIQRFTRPVVPAQRATAPQAAAPCAPPTVSGTQVGLCWIQSVLTLTGNPPPVESITSNTVLRAPCTGTVTGTAAPSGSIAGDCSVAPAQSAFQAIATLSPPATSYVDTSVTSGAWVYEVETTGTCPLCTPATAISAPSNMVAISIAASAPPPPPPPPGCFASGIYPAWTNRALTAQSGTFTLSFDATPGTGSDDDVYGVSVTAAAAFTDLATIVRFNDSTEAPAGTISAMKGSAGNDTYAADATVAYQSGKSYHVVETINLAAHTYSVTVTPSGGSAVAIATNYPFRSTQASVTSVANFGAITSDAGATAQVCNLTAGTVAPPPPPPPAVGSVAISPTSAMINTGATQQFVGTVTCSVAGCATTVSWKTSGGSISSAGLLTAPATAGTVTVTATSTMDATKAANSTVTVVAPPPPPTGLTISGFTASVNGTRTTLSASFTDTVGTPLRWAIFGNSKLLAQNSCTATKAGCTASWTGASTDAKNARLDLGDPNGVATQLAH